MDPKTENQSRRITPEYAQYQRQNFWGPSQAPPIHPPFNTDPGKLEEQAKEKLSQGGWLYASSNAGTSQTHLANRQAFFAHKIVPRMLVDTSRRDTAYEIWGHKVAAPIGFAPVGINKIYHGGAEEAVAKVAGQLNLPYCLSTAGSASIESVGSANGPNGVRFFQLYMPHDDELTISLLQRAHDSGFTGCMLTTDTWQLGWRHDDVANSNYAFYRGTGFAMGATDPIFQKRLKSHGIDPERDPERAGALWIDNVWHGRPHSWEKIPWLIEQWKRIAGNNAPFAIKGIQSPADAKHALKIDDAIVVSNHAGRQVDGAIASLEALRRIQGALTKEERSRLKLFFDSGVRSAADVFKALALGADFVFVGRLWIWGLSIAGEEGVRHVMKSLLAELDILMNVAGCQSVEDMRNGDWLVNDEGATSGGGLIAERSKL